MSCHVSDVCVNYSKKCLECQRIAEDINTLPYYEKRKPPVSKFKIFWGNHTMQSADEKINQWIVENPAIKLVSYQYQQARLGDHSICVEYIEEREHDR